MHLDEAIDKRASNELKLKVVLDFAHILGQLELSLSEKRALLANQRIDGDVAHLLLIRWIRTLILLPAEEDGKLIEDDGEVQIDLALRDLTERRRRLLCVTTSPLEDQIGITLFLGVASNTTDLGLYHHSFLCGAAEHARYVL